MKALFLVDGEHYIPVNRDGVSDVARRRGYEPVGAAFIGGMEKIGSPEDLKQFDIPVIIENDPLRAVAKAIEEFQPDVTVDLSDEPVVSASRH